MWSPIQGKAQTDTVSVDNAVTVAPTVSCVRRAQAERRGYVPTMGFFSKLKEQYDAVNAEATAMASAALGVPEFINPRP